jgi:acyl-coenzyme A thioesterase PaaI-like protein
MSDADSRLSAVLGSIPYARFIGMRAELAGDEMTALAQLSVAEPLKRQPRTIDISIEYLRSGRPLTTFARARINKVGRRIANVHVEAWQEQRAAPIAALRGHFLLTSAED